MCGSLPISKVLDLREQGLTYGEISKQLNVGANTVTRWINRDPELPDKVSRLGKTAMKPEAFILRSQGLNNSEIAKKLKITPATVSRWLGPTPRL